MEPHPTAFASALTPKPPLVDSARGADGSLRGGSMVSGPSATASGKGAARGSVAHSVRAFVSTQPVDLH